MPVVFDRIEQQYGVPGPVLVAFWGLETDFGKVMGNMETMRSLATLSFDCRRPEEFQEQLIYALKVIERGDLTPDEMRGPAHGEVGQFQFQPKNYYEYAVDFDGDGRRDLMQERAGFARLGCQLFAVDRLARQSALARASACAGGSCRGTRPT